MPRYDYECQTCHNVFEVRQGFTSEPVANCPICLNGARRVFHAVPIVFKGSGFYVNDYGKGKNGASSTKESESQSESKSDSKAESTKEPEKKTSPASDKVASKKEPASAKS